MLNGKEKPVTESTMLNKEEIISENMFLGLRLIDGINIDDFYNKFNTHIDEIYGESIKKLINKKLMIREDKKIFLTDKGLDLANQVFVEFI